MFTPVLLSGTNQPAQGNSFEIQLSEVGQYLVFVSDADDLVTNDFNGEMDVFRMHLPTGDIELISEALDGFSGHPNDFTGSSVRPVINLDAYHIAFESTALNLVTNELYRFNSNAIVYPDVFLWEGSFGDISAVSQIFETSDKLTESAVPGLTWGGTGESSVFCISPDGRWSVFRSGPLIAAPEDDRYAQILYRYDHQKGEVIILDPRILDAPEEQRPVFTSMYEDSLHAISADGNRIAFGSQSEYLVTNDGNAARDIFVRDVSAHQTHLISQNLFGRSADNVSFAPFMDDAGEKVLFESLALNLVLGDANQTNDLYVRLIDEDQTLLVSESIEGGTGNGRSYLGRLSRDGRWVAFLSFADDLVPNDTNQIPDVFLKDLETGNLKMISDHPAWTGFSRKGGFRPEMTRSNSRFITFQSIDCGIFLHDREAETTVQLRSQASLEPAKVTVEGQLLVFAAPAGEVIDGSDNPHLQLFTQNLNTGQIRLLTRRHPDRFRSSPNGYSSISDRPMSSDGRFLAFSSAAGNLVQNAEAGSFQVYVRDRRTEQYLLETESWDQSEPANGPSFAPKISPDGRHLLFVSGASNLAPNDQNEVADLFLRDRDTGVTKLITRLPDGSSFGGGTIDSWSMSNDGEWVVFITDAPGLDASDTNSLTDVYLYGASTETVTLLSRNEEGTAPNDQRNLNALIFPEGDWVAFLREVGFGPVYSVELYNRLTGELESIDETFYSKYPEGLALAASLEPPQLVYALEGGFGLYDPQSSTRYFQQVNIDLEPEYHDFFLNGLPRFSSSAGMSGEPAFIIPIGKQYLLHRDIHMGMLGSDSIPKLEIDPMQTSVSLRLAGESFITPDGRWVVVTDERGAMILYNVQTQQSQRLDVSLVNGTALHQASVSHSLASDGYTLVFASNSTLLAPGIDHHTANIFTIRLGMPDGDEDGLPDDWELTFLGNLEEDGNSDSDGDGLTDEEEYRAGTNPQDGQSVLKAFTATDGGGNVYVMWSAVPGETYQVQYLDDLDSTDWQLLDGQVAATTATGMKLDDSENQPLNRFYRVVLLE